MNGWLFLHLLALGTWLGCILVEAILESLAQRDAALQAGVARAHFWIDMLAEIPAFTLVAVSGVAMLQPDRLHGDYAVMVVAGSLAIAVNVLCVLPVVRRRQLVLADGDVAATRAQTQRILLAFAVGLPCGLLALFAGLRLGGLLP